MTSKRDLTFLLSVVNVQNFPNIMLICRNLLLHLELNNVILSNFSLHTSVNYGGKWCIIRIFVQTVSIHFVGITASITVHNNLRTPTGFYITFRHSGEQMEIWWIAACVLTALDEARRLLVRTCTMTDPLNTQSVTEYTTSFTSLLNNEYRIYTLHKPL